MRLQSNSCQFAKIYQTNRNIVAIVCSVDRFDSFTAQLHACHLIHVIKHFYVLFKGPNSFNTLPLSISSSSSSYFSSSSHCFASFAKCKRLPKSMKWFYLLIEMCITNQKRMEKSEMSTRGLGKMPRIMQQLFIWLWDWACR